jgi:hypothetical protein
MRYALLIFALMLSGTLAAAVYKWVDSQGNVNYSDIPEHPSAEPVDLPDFSRYEPRVPEMPSIEADEDERPEQAAKPEKRVLEIVQPEVDATVRNNQGIVPVVLLLNPSLEEGQYLQLMLDGTPVEGKHTTTSMQLEGVLRGPHVLQAKLMDEEGRTLFRSESLRFFMRQASRFDPQRRPNATPLPGGAGAGSGPPASPLPGGFGGGNL